MVVIAILNLSVYTRTPGIYKQNKTKINIYSHKVKDENGKLRVNYKKIKKFFEEERQLCIAEFLH